ncbi:hypothetical protein [Haloarchaeobius litoreus]|uniref:Tat (Twin-arginine translocation) pathway signal sequence n=1 Tax=Haloarchaeobius litoreus TaxID=755306 RepID=A0ABD6DNX2_9EURY|nr:hypothetical protein [Haloarchaeobius litoreus]
MVQLSRRALLRASALPVAVGVGGCFGFFESYPPTDLLVVNGDDASRPLWVRVTDTEGTTLFEETYTVPANGRLEREDIVDTGPIRVFAYSDEDETAVPADAWFDFEGCRQARPVITIRESHVSRIGKQDTCRPTESTYE